LPLKSVEAPVTKTPSLENVIFAPINSSFVSASVTFPATAVCPKEAEQ